MNNHREDDTLIERLRVAGTHCGALSDVNHLFDQAADTIEALTKRLDAAGEDRATRREEMDAEMRKVKALTAKIAGLEGEVERKDAAVNDALNMLADRRRDYEVRVKQAIPVLTRAALSPKDA